MTNVIVKPPVEKRQEEVSVWDLENGFYELEEWGTYGNLFVLGGIGEFRCLLSLRNDKSVWFRGRSTLLYPAVRVIRKFDNVELS